MASNSAPTKNTEAQGSFFAELMKSSRKKLLDLSLRNKLLNFPPVAPDYNDDGRAHKFLKVGGRLQAVWERLVDDTKALKIYRYSPVELQNALKRLNEASRKTAARTEADLLRQQIREITEEIAEGEAMVNEGHLWVDKLSEEAYQKRLRRLRDEAKTLEDTTGDSAFFIACGFLKWPEKPKTTRVAVDPAKDGISTARYAPLILIKVTLTDEGKGSPGRRKFRVVPQDAPQDNQSLKAKLKDEWDFTLPDLGENAKPSDYFFAVRSAISLSRLGGFEVVETLALGFFNFARYRLWLDLDPKQWTEGGSPESHPIVKSILGVSPLETSSPPIIDATRNEEIADEVARHQETQDIPIVRDADTSQYSALLYAQKGKSLVVIGPPGSGKSQTITNLVATSIANGKKVLFVAQKLPALDVVARRIKEAGLSEFCLQFYSAKHDGEPERKPVTPLQIHSQLTAARNILRYRHLTSATNRRAPILAKQLNSYASSVHGAHPVYGESIQRILCTALKLKEEASTTWGNDWDDALLAVILPDGTALSSEWIDTRSRLLGDIARLNHEAGDFWNGWTPDNLTVLDIPKVEGSLEGHRRAVKSLCTWCSTINSSLLDWDQLTLQRLAEAVNGITALETYSDGFIRAISDSNELMRLAHEIERELRTAETAGELGTALLAIMPEGTSATAMFTSSHLAEVERGVESTATYTDVQESLENLNALLRITDVILQALPIHPDGLVAYGGDGNAAPTISLLIRIAQLEDGKFRRAPTVLLPALARLLVSQPTLADDAMVIADRADALVEKKAEAARVFGQTIRAEKFFTDELILQLSLACESGVGKMPVAQIDAVSAASQAAEQAALALLAVDRKILHAARFDGDITNGFAAELGSAAGTINTTELVRPPDCDARLAKAWADATISESEARAAAAAQEKAAMLTDQIYELLGDAPPTAQTAAQLESSMAAAGALGLPVAQLSEIAILKARLDNLERSISGIIAGSRRLGNLAELVDFQSVADAATIATAIAPFPNLTDAKPGKLADSAFVTNLVRTVVLATETRSYVARGAAKTLVAAATSIRGCIQAVNAAEEVAAGLTGIRRPSTLRELRSLGAATPVLRSIPALPIGCDAVQMSGEQYAATIRHLFEIANRLGERFRALPQGVDYNSVLDHAEARRKLTIFREKQNSALRFLSGEWRAARSTIKSFAPNLDIIQAVAAFDSACAIKSDEESFAEDTTGKAALGSYFRGVKTDWKPFVAFSDWVEKLTQSLDGYERNERVVAVWRSEMGAITGVANACAHFESAASDCRTTCPDLFDAADSPFQLDTPIATAKQRATSTLNRIEALLASPTLALASVRDAPTASYSVTEIIDLASSAEKELATHAEVARELVGQTFAGYPEDWNRMREIAAWTTNIHNSRTLGVSRHNFIEACIAAQDTIEQFIGAAQSFTSSLAAVRQILAQSRIRPDDAKSVGVFFTDAHDCLSQILSGGAALRGLPGDSVVTFRKAATLIKELIFELGRSERLRQAVAPKLPTTTSVESTLSWALSLHARNLPKRLVALLAEFPDHAPDVQAFLNHANTYSKRLETLRTLGCATAEWANPSATVKHTADCSASLSAGLAAARRGATEGGAAPTSTIEEIHVGAKSVRDYLRLLSQIDSWTTTLGCDPFVAENPGEAIRETIFWVESLHTDRIPLGVMAWLVVSQADQRMHWWSSLVRNTKAWRCQRTSLRQSSLPEFDETTTLATWRSELSNRQVALAVAVDQLARVVKVPGTPLAKLRSASELLRNSAEALTRARSIQERIPGATTIHTSHDVAANRAFSAWITAQLRPVTEWALLTPKADVYAHVRSLRSLLDNEVDSWNDLAQTFSAFGSCKEKGPSGILNDEQSLSEASNGIDLALSNLHGLSAWAALQRELKRTKKLGVDRISTEVLQKKATPEEAVAAFKAAVAWQKAIVVWKENPHLERFRSARHEELRTEFAKEDIAAVQSDNRQRIISSLHDKTGGGMASWGNGYIDQLLLHEATKRRKLMSVRKLVDAAGKRMQDLCPCWLATPAAIAQFMGPGKTDFDLIIMDEASQLTPEDSWGAITRGRQAVIVGDPKQMPPSSFFEHASTDDDDETEPENPEPTDKPQGPVLKGHQQESVLKAAEACLPQVWLNWHYRSLHEGLIAPANTLSYERRLVLFPSAHLNHHHLGVRHTYVQDGTATTGQVKNANEAMAVVNQLVKVAADFAQASHRQLAKAPHSVGIIAMNIHQQETIKDLIDHRRTQDPFFDRNLAVLESHESEPFFVRNLENVQGDERDVIIISTTYGPNTPGGTPAQRFFPINQEGGERRFNVLITRAKWRMEVFTSLRSAQLTSPQLGVQHMRTFLEYCETGRLSENGVTTGRGFDSPFEAHVHAVLEANGYAVVKQVGVAGYFLDLAIKDTLAPDRYVLGIECDGATYHSSRAARDRDRLREQVLNERGWVIHRIWSTEWFYNNAAIRKSLFAACDKAIARG
jgi:very-short-patch-repair endonuclease